MSIGKTLRKLRSDKKLTQKDLADILHITRTTYVKYETDSIKLSFEKASELATFFKITTDELLETQPAKTLPSSSSSDNEPHIVDLMNILDQPEIVFHGTTYKLNENIRGKIVTSLENILQSFNSNLD
jgi:transcriptional regulator with XRE-family HTH domain